MIVNNTLAVNAAWISLRTFPEGKEKKCTLSSASCIDYYASQR